MKLRHLAFGLCVALSVPPTDAEGGPWCVLAYEAELKGYRLPDGTHARITATDIDQMVANFSRYPKAPLVVEHADTREGMPAEWAQPRGHVVAVRRGSMERTVGGVTKTVVTLEGRLDVSPDVRLSIVGDAATQTPPVWPFCSITTARGIDEETGVALGTVLYSVSLTAHPRLADLPRLAASANGAELGYWYGELKTRGDVVSMLREIFDLPVVSGETEVLSALTRLEGLLGTPEDQSGVDVDDIVHSLRRALRLDALKTSAEVVAGVRQALTVLPAAEGSAPAEMSRGAAAANRPKEGKPMKTMLELAAALKLTAVATEEAALSAVTSLAQDGAAVRTTLGLAPDAPLAPALAELVTARAELGKLAPELTALRAEKATRDEAELTRRVDEVCLSRGFGDDVKPALVAFAKSDRKAFDEKFPAPSVQELAQRAQDPARSENITGQGGANGANAKAADPGKRDDVAARAQALRGVASEFGQTLSTLDALEMIQRGATPDSLRAQLKTLG